MARSFGWSQRDENTAVEMPSKRRKGGRPSLVTPLYVQTDSSEVSVCSLCERALRERFLCRSEQGLRRQASVLRNKTRRNKAAQLRPTQPAHSLGPVMNVGVRMRCSNKVAVWPKRSWSGLVPSANPCHTTHSLFILIFFIYIICDRPREKAV